ncbi:hypothetical protein K788_0004742 [Paraburkholderia caribensis MBA4]|uniref:Uncharacterized protein n=1 Tax=Paraburkholderia caribensis MBA4 TaxID=1323664 RepID=A0A0P0RKG7_9BURK|nr:hypothetical protein K788_0004742 [Paraburkholderia caribensis MBA4]
MARRPVHEAKAHLRDGRPHQAGSREARLRVLQALSQALLRNDAAAIKAWLDKTRVCIRGAG